MTAPTLKCPVCQSSVPLALAKNNVLWGYCKGQIEGIGCGTKIYLDHRETRRIQKEQPADDPPVQPAPPTDPKPQPQPKKEPAHEPAPAAKPGRTGTVFDSL